MGSLQNRVALITGASSGIGKATALALAQAGADVGLVARRRQALEAVAEAVRALGRRALVLPADVTDAQAAQQAVEQTMAHFGQIDLLVANAGVYYREPTPQLTLETLHASMAVNFYGSVHFVLAVLPHMLHRRSGHIVLVTSMDAKKGIPPDGPYVAAKYALSGLADVMRQELRPYGIAVTTVFPGRVDTPMIADLEVPWLSAKIAPETVAQAIVRATRRRPAEIVLPPQARLLVWLQCLSPRLADWAVRVFRLSGWPRRAA